ncbi:hypothetical protein D3C80_1906850 [compost metagenome]
MSEMKVIKNYPMDLSIELLFLRSIATACDRLLWVEIGFSRTVLLVDFCLSRRAEIAFNGRSSYKEGIQCSIAWEIIGSEC